MAEKYSELPTFEEVDASPVTVEICLPSFPGVPVDRVSVQVTPQSDPSLLAQRTLEQNRLPTISLPWITSTIQTHQQHLRQQRLDERDDRPPQQQQEKQNQQQHQNQQQQQNQLGKEEEKEVEVEEEQLSLETTGQQNQGDASDTLVAQWKDAFVDSCREYRHARTAADNGEDAEQFDEDAISFSERFHELIHSPFLVRFSTRVGSVSSNRIMNTLLTFFSSSLWLITLVCTLLSTRSTTCLKSRMDTPALFKSSLTSETRKQLACLSVCLCVSLSVSLCLCVCVPAKPPLCNVIHLPLLAVFAFLPWGGGVAVVAQANVAA